jgi:hypothetical protein
MKLIRAPAAPAPAPVLSPALAAIRLIYSKHGTAGFFTGYQANLLKDLPLSVCKMVFFEATALALCAARSSSYYPAFLVPASASTVAVAAAAPAVVAGADAAVSSSPPTAAAGAAAAAAAAAETAPKSTRTPLSSSEAAVAGCVSGVLTVLTTQPLDVVNTRMKAPGAPTEVARSMAAAARDVMARGGGVGALWQGTVPRGLSFGLGAGVFWTCFAEIQKHMRALGIE